MPETACLTIGEVAERTGASVRAVRYYEQHGLLTAERTSAGHRQFAPDAVETVRRIRLLLGGGLPLDIVAQVIPCFEDDGARLASCVQTYLADHMDVLRERAATIEHQQGTLAQLQKLASA